MVRRITLIALLLMLSVSALFAQVTAVPSAMNFQGRLATQSGNPVPNGTYSIRFSLWDAFSAGTEKWNKTLATVTVKNGTFAVTLDTFPAGTFNGNLWLEIKVGADAALAPRQQLVTVPYAFKADTVPDGSITGVKIAPGTITADKLAAGVGGLSLPFAASTASSDAFLFDLTNTDAGGAARFSGASGNYSVYAKGGAYNGLYAETTASGGNGIVGVASVGTGAYGVLGYSSAGIGVVGSSISGYAGYFNNKVQVNAGLAVTGASSPYPASIGNGVFIEGGGGTYAAVYGFNYATLTPVNLVLNTPGGNVGIGTLTPGYTLDVAGSFHNTNGVYGFNGSNGTGVWGTSNNGVGVRGVSNTNYGIVGSSSSNYAGYFTGSVFTTGTYNGSDARYKTHIAGLSSALDTVLALRGVTYEYRRDAFPTMNFPAGPQIGFIAQEVQKLLPALVRKDSDGYLSLDYSHVTPLLVEAVKAQQKQIAELKAAATENAELKAHNADMEKRTAELEKQIAALAAAMRKLQEPK